ncbi:alpha/beta-hydrolase superfamily protein, putative [Medicago truncatula]|uniref:Alpha/beta-hydrolase superfamily protein, putative n=1 Tax=Medicago truncatula TaxID=3880 RepID=G7JS34_MEDTR|nr:alpha/beta-hydrolase superfamily protein, putative [Medicago truncatula]
MKYGPMDRPKARWAGPTQLLYGPNGIGSNDIRTVANLSGNYDLMAGVEDRLGNNFMKRIRKEGFIE